MDDQRNLLLENKLSETRAVIRAYDVKAQIVGVGFIFALGILADLDARIAKDLLPTWLGVLVIWLVAMLPISLFGYVIFPFRRPAPFLWLEGGNDAALFSHKDRDGHSSIVSVLEGVTSADPNYELAAELRHAEMVRRVKKARFARAMKGATISLVVLFVFQFVRSVL